MLLGVFSLLLMVFAPAAFGHAGHAHPTYGPPSPEWAWASAAAAASAEDARERQAFAIELAQAPEERNGRCSSTADFEGIGDGCRTDDGLLRVELPGGGTTLTHGPDYLEAATDAEASSMPTRMVAAIQGATKDDIACVPSTDRHTLLVYAIPADGIDRSATIVPQLRQSAYELSAVIDNEAQLLSPGSGRRLKMACEGSGEARVEVQRLPTARAGADFSTVQADLHARLGSAPSTGAARYLVFYDAHLGDYAGIGQFNTDDALVAGNDNNRGGRVALQDSSDGGGPNWEVLLHEASHNMGAVQDGAPDSNEVGHCNDGLDIMCYAEPSTPGVVGSYSSSVCALNQFDCGHDTYFHTAPAGGDYLATRWNLGSPLNAFLEVTSTTTDTTAPSAPTGVAGTGHGTFIRLTWDASTDAGSGVHSYRVYRDAGAGGWVPVDDAWPGERTLDTTWSGIAANTTYTLRVTAFDRRGNESAPASLTVSSGSSSGTVRVVGGTLPAPYNVHVASSTASAVTIGWEGTADRYRIQKRNTSGGWTSGATTSARTYSLTTTSTGAALSAGTRYELRVTATDSVGRTSDPIIVAGWTTGGPDTAAPAAPGGLAIASTAGASPTIGWNAVGDATSYVVSVRDSSGVWTQRAIVTSLTRAVDGLAWGQSYTLGVAARDEAGNTSARTTVAFTTGAAPDRTAPSSPTLTSTGTLTPTTIPVNWSSATDNVAVTGYRVYVTRADANHYQLAAQTNGALSATVTGLTPQVTYYLRIFAVDAAGNASSSLTYYTRTTPADTTAPTVPGSLTASNQTQTSVQLTWNASTDAVGVAGYRIYRREANLSWTLLGTTTATAWEVTGLTAGTAYTFGVAAYDAAGNTSANATVTTSTASAPPDLLAPTEPGGLSADAVSGTTAALSWTASSDDVGVSGYRVYRTAPNASETPIGSPTGTSYTATGLTPATTYTLAVAARDAAGNESTRASVTFTTPDTIAPSAPGSLAAGGTTETSTTLTWTASTDNVGVASYRIERTAPTAAVLGTTTGTSRAIADLAPGTTYTFRVVAIDTSGNEAGTSVTLTTPDVTAPSVPGSAAAGAPTGSSVPLSWSASTDNVAVTSYRVYRVAPNASGTPIATLGAGATSTTITGLASETTYTFAIAARDAAGNESAHAQVSATTLDVTAPTTPGSLAAGTRTTTSIAISWGASTDTSGAVSYLVERRPATGGSWTLVAAAHGSTSIDVTGLAPSSSYQLGVTARDAAGNASARATITASTLDVVAPSQPGAITVGTVTGSSVALSWGASSDDVALAGYRVYRQAPDASASPVLTPSGASATIGGLESGVTYTFAITAVDTSGNESATRAVTVATADVVAPTTPGSLRASVVGEQSLTLEWNASTDNVGVAGYRVYSVVGGVAGFLAGTASTSHVVNGLAPATSYTFQVEAFDAAGRVSSRAALDVRTVDTTAPSMPGSLAASSTSDTRVQLAWTSSSDNVGVTAYRVYLADAGRVLLATVASPGYLAQDLAADADHAFEVTALDAAGNESAAATLSVRTAAEPDLIAPTSPPAATIVEVGTGNAQLAWTAATDTGGVAHYRVEQLVGGSWTLRATTTATDLFVTGLEAGTRFEFRILAVDAAGNVSAASATAVLTTTQLDASGPTQPGGPIAATATASGSVGLSWRASSDPSGVAGYRIWRLTGSGWALVATTTQTTVTVTGVPAGQLATFAVAAFDTVGNESTRTLVDVQVPSPLRAAPGMPSALTASATMSTITVRWQAPSDATEYRIQVLKAGTEIATSSSTVTSVTLGPYAPGTVLTVRVAAAGPTGTSPAASIDVSTLSDTIKPTRPGAVRALASGGSKLAISWGISRDALGIARYEVRLAAPRVRAKVVRATASARSITATRLVRGRLYTVTVRAIDRSENASAWSAPVRIRVR